MTKDKYTRLVQQTLLAGFKAGWRAATETIAGHLEDALEMIRKAGQDAQGFSVDVADLLVAVRAQAENPPTPQLVEMEAGEKPEDVDLEARGQTPQLPPPSKGPIPSAEEALSFVATIVQAMPDGRSERRQREEWVALLGFALLIRDCAAAEGLLGELEREAARVRDIMVGDAPLPRTKPMKPEASA